MDIFTNQEEITNRKEICGNCPSSKLGICTECGCLLEAKIRYYQVTCPLNKWPKPTNIITKL